MLSLSFRSLEDLKKHYETIKTLPQGSAEWIEARKNIKQISEDAVTRKWIEDEEFLTEWIKINPLAIRYANRELENYDQLAIEALKKDKVVASYITGDLKNSSDVKKILESYEQVEDATFNVKLSILNSYKKKEIRLEEVHPALLNDYLLRDGIYAEFYARLNKIKSKYTEEFTKKSGINEEVANKIQQVEGVLAKKLSESKKYTDLAVGSSLEELSQFLKVLEESLTVGLDKQKEREIEKAKSEINNMDV